MSPTLPLSFAVGVLSGGLGRLAYELARWLSWRSLEDEVERWKVSPRGRFHAYLDGLTNPPTEGY